MPAISTTPSKDAAQQPKDDTNYTLITVFPTTKKTKKAAAKLSKSLSAGFTSAFRRIRTEFQPLRRAAYPVLMNLKHVCACLDAFNPPAQPHLPATRTGAFIIDKGFDCKEGVNILPLPRIMSHLSPCSIYRNCIFELPTLQHLMNWISDLPYRSGLVNVNGQSNMKVVCNFGMDTVTWTVKWGGHKRVEGCVEFFKGCTMALLKPRP
ncbi:hypothetical protein EJ02DRAFT_423454 [Clathrospora elynae]|uniref:Uncharacterized protein n=1 Tax=Clathrospora elynae TaxID=706981 RepID=A0A6A5SMX9_9PLEO|nr:hypothetical protein EJ02DRAFT_423454 [Clathrospora elynae]